ncbi:sigma-70 family RNA polymerase sigma factor [Rhodoferax bucti]|uniref:sigma-70 family RNA polymerase sigma factor n=1 Tax=Rhodoferax bucti TaxID=2576305 RepID=UPI00110952CA|nr:sigma-70 family RNA polymerase sigma factor [Rhodoferax bucti]
MHPSQLREQLPGLRRYARALTGNAWAADDLVQDTLERACDKWRLWSAGTDLRAWLFTIMHNIHASDLRRTLRQQQLAPTGPWDQEAQKVADAPSNSDMRLDLQHCLMQLPQEQRTVLLLVVLEDMSYAEVAAITATPIGTVMSRLSRARSRLEALMNGPAAKETHSEPAGAQIIPLHGSR